jgi:ElaB/YqjD/DUF883 family membrane-anchored ribosome-binding protein
MSEALPDKTEGLPEPEARPPVAPPVHGTAPSFEDPVEQPLPINTDNTIMHTNPTTETAAPFGVDAGGRMNSTAEKIGTVVGTAQRQMRRGLELVRRPGGGSQISDTASDIEQRATDVAREGMERASRLMEDIEVDVADARREAARRLDEWSKDAGARFQEARRRARTALAGSQKRAQELGDAYPLQTIAAIAGCCFVLGVAMRFGRSRRG